MNFEISSRIKRFVKIVNMSGSIKELINIQMYVNFSNEPLVSSTLFGIISNIKINYIKIILKMCIFLLKKLKIEILKI